VWKLPSLWVDVEDGLEHFLALGGEYFGRFEVPRHDLFVQFVGIGVFEGEEAAQHGIQDDPAGPDIHPDALVSLSRDHLGRGVAGRPACGLQSLSRFVLVGEAEVDDLDVFVLVEEQVLGLEVAVHYSVFVDVFHPRQDLLHEGDCLGLGKSLALDDMVEQFSALRVLHDEVDVCLCFDDLYLGGGT
jgi:hypothetical protein